MQVRFPPIAFPATGVTQLPRPTLAAKLQDGTRAGNHGCDLEPVPDDGRGGQQGVDLGRAERGDRGGIEAVEGAAKGLETARKQLVLLETNGLTTPERSNWALEHITAHTGFEDSIAMADLVIESAPENMAFKQDLFARLDAIAKPEAVLASNTSGLSITAIAERCTLPPGHRVPCASEAGLDDGRYREAVLNERATRETGWPFVHQRDPHAHHQ